MSAGNRFANLPLKRVILLAGSLGLLIILLVLLGVSVYGRESPKFIGTDMGGNAAPGFRLTNQFNEFVSLSDLRGKVVVLTFLYTSCPDVCPLTAARIRQVYQQLEPATQDQVAVIAVSVDPDYDTVEAAYTFLENFGMAERWSFLVGSREELEPVWETYYVGVLVDNKSHDDHDHSHDDREVRHTAPIFLIDDAGQLRVLHTTGEADDTIIDDLRHDIDILLDQI